MRYILSVFLILFVSCSKVSDNNSSTQKIHINQIKEQKIRNSFLNSKSGIAKRSMLQSNISELTHADNLQLNGLDLVSTSALLQDSIAFIGFQYSGDEYSGAVLILNISDPIQPIVKNVITYENADIRELFFVRKNSTNFLFVGGASFIYEGRPSFVAQLTLDDNYELNEETDTKFYDLPSFGVTGFVQKSSVGNTLYVSTGYKSGGVSTIDIPNKTLEENVVELENIKSISYETSGLYILTNDHIFKYDKNNYFLLDSKNLSFDNELEFKSTMNIYGSTIVTSMGHDGTNLYNLNDFNLLDSIPQVNFTKNTNLFPQLYLYETVTNDAVVSDKLLITANGGAGVHIYKYNNDIKNLEDSDVIETHSYFLVNEGESVNSVDYESGILLTAAGKGGYYILSVQQ